jgi:membrane-associated phospholipid phosphatase
VLVAVLAGCANESFVGVEVPDAAYWKGYVQDSGDMLRRPGSWQRRDWLTFAGLTACTLAVYSGDEWIRREVQESRDDATEDLAFYAEKLGRWENLLMGFGALHGVGWASGDAGLKEVSLLGVEGVVLSALAIRVVKYVAARERPYNESGAGAFNWWAIEEDWTSFPSGHTTVVFAAATAFHMEYRNKWVSAAAYSLAVLSGWSRIHDDMHWASDVLAGATVGTVVTRGVFRARRGRRESGEGPEGPTAQLVVTPGGAGVAFRF